MSKSKLMHYLEPFKYLKGDDLNMKLGHWLIHILLQITVFEVFHSDEDVVCVLEPSLEFNE